jgi:hypothetical protein
MAYVAPSTVTAGTSPITAAAQNILVNDIIDHETRIAAGEAAWTSFTPTWSGITIGNGTNSAAYLKVGKHVAFRASFTLGSTSAITGSIGVQFPVTAISLFSGVFVGFFQDTGAGWSPAICISGDGSGIALYASAAAGAYVNANLTSSTVPHTWASTDVVSVSGVYQAA